MSKEIGIKKKSRKKPQDYPQLAFRVTDEIKVEIMDEVEEIAEGLNKRRGEKDYIIRKNDVIVEALRIGLKQLKKRI
jgi:hypothetical protein